MRILLVHDDEDALMHARRALRPSHLIWHVTMVTNAASARAELARRAYDLVIADGDMHDGDGDDSYTDAVRHTPRIPLDGASHLVERIAALENRKRATCVNASSLSDALARLVIMHAITA